MTCNVMFKEVNSLLTERQADTMGPSSALPGAITAAVEPEVKRTEDFGQLFQKAGQQHSEQRNSLR